MTRNQDETFTMRISGEEKEMLTKLADADGRSASNMLRAMIRAAYEKRFGRKKK